MDNSLQSLIKEFRLTEEDREIILHKHSNKIPETFRQIARTILSGYFLITKGKESKKIQPTCIEIYYHEESGEDAIKDYIVYHRNNPKNPKKAVALYSPGILNPHVSGIDVTFEHKNGDQVVRASALIRAFSVNGRPSEPRSTYLYDAILSAYSIFEGGFHIEWHDGELIDPSLIRTAPRKNVKEFDLEKITKTEEPDPRTWQFYNAEKCNQDGIPK